MLKDKFISITDLRKNASTYIWWIVSWWEKIIFVNNKPRAVLIDFELYDKFISWWNMSLYQVYDKDLSERDLKELAKVQKMSDDEFYNI